MATKKIEFTAKNIKSFSAWLKKFSSIDQSLLLEVDEENSLFCAKTHNEERSVVKYSKIKFDDAGLLVKPSKDPKMVKVGIYNINRLMKILNQFDNSEFSFVINYDEFSGDVQEWVGLDIILKNKDLKMNVECASLKIFKYISDELFKDRIASLEETNAEFEYTKQHIEQTNSLCSLDDDSWKFMDFKKSNNIYVCGKNFEYLVEEKSESNDKEYSISIYKDQFNSIDTEDYIVKMGEYKLVFENKTEDTIIVVSMVEKD